MFFFFQIFIRIIVNDLPKEVSCIYVCERAAHSIDTFNGRVKDYEQNGKPVYIIYST